MSATKAMFRDFRWTDIPAAVAIDAEAFPYDPWSAETFWGELARMPRAARYLAADSSTELAGYAGIAVIDTEAHLQTLAVIPRQRGRGIARAMLSEVLSDAARRGAKRCLLEVKPDNDAAIALYTSVGFTQLGTRPGYYPGGDSALVLSCDLEAAA